MTKDECLKLNNDFVPLEYNGFKVYVTPTGRVKSWNGKEFVEKQWRYNADGYPVVSVQDGNRYRSIAVHIFVANAWIANPLAKPEVNHLDFDRKNPWAYNLEWVTHQENVAYSRKAGHYPDFTGEKNPNYGNNTLHLKYVKDKEYAKQKQGRPGGRNGKSKPCNLFHKTKGLIATFEYQREAVHYLTEANVVEKGRNLESIIKRLRSEKGYKDYYLKLI